MRSPVSIPLLLIVVSTMRLSAAEQMPFREEQGVRWYDARSLDVEGRGFTDVKEFYDRLPARAEQTVRDAVWGLSRNSSGLCVRFRAATPALSVRWKLRSPTLALPHMAATGVSGVDLYGKTDDGAWRWIAVGKPAGLETTQKLAGELDRAPREYRVYLPLYNGVTSVEIGVPADAAVERSTDPALRKKPVVFYGTSIMQGACASRTGMAQSSILGRRLNVPVINLGFSGNGRMEPEVAALLAELDPAAYVVDCLPNMDAAAVRQNAEALVRTLRKARPSTPIVLVEDRTYADAHWSPSRRERNLTSRREFRAVYDRLVRDGVEGLTYVAGDPLLRDDGEDTVDGSHPTDLGFMRYADVLAPVLEPLLK